MGYVSGVGRQAPSFTLPALDGGEISLADYRGDWFPVVMFLSPDDERAVAALKALAGAADRLWGLRGQVVGIVAAGDQWERSALEDLAVPVLVDRGGEVARSYGTRADGTGRDIPLVCIVDRAGRIVWSGRPDPGDIAAEVVRAFRDVAR